MLAVTPVACSAYWLTRMGLDILPEFSLQAVLIHTTE
jgi:hypothetical protein